MLRRLLLLANTTGYQTRSFGEAARTLGVELVFGTDRCHRLDDPWQDAALPLRFDHVREAADAIAEFARRKPVHGIVAVGDKPTMTAALAAELLGLPWHPLDAARICQDKFLARRQLCAAGLASPRFVCAPVEQGPAALLGGVAFPCVLKPVRMSASRGVIRADNAAQFNAAFGRIAALLRDLWEPVLAEEFIPGREFAVEALMDRGRLRVLAIFDKPDPLDGPFFEETIYTTPSRLPDDDQREMVETLDRAVSALGLYHGPLHAEFRLNDRGPWLIEVAARPIGGLCSRALRFGDGSVSLEEILIRNALAEPVDAIKRERAAAGVMMIPVPREGVFERADGLEEARAVSGVEDIIITAKTGERLIPWPEGASYPGFIFARADTPAQVERALREAHAKLVFRVVPALAVVK